MRWLPSPSTISAREASSSTNPAAWSAATPPSSPSANSITFRDFEPGETGHHLRPDHVLGVGMATSMLSTLTVRYDAARMLDLGTGQGFHAMAAAGHCGRIIATDVNPLRPRLRPLGVEANAIDNIELRQGSPSNPSPPKPPSTSSSAIRPSSSPPPRARLPRRRLRRRRSRPSPSSKPAPAHLADNGFACIACNWHHADADAWSNRPRHWLANAGCDARLIRFAADRRRVR
jgi:hypothetical protein